MTPEMVIGGFTAAGALAGGLGSFWAARVLFNRLLNQFYQLGMDFHNFQIKMTKDITRIGVKQEQMTEFLKDMKEHDKDIHELKLKMAEAQKDIDAAHKGIREFTSQH